MKRAKRIIVAAVVVLALISGAVTVYAVSAEKDGTDVTPQPIAAEYAAEEMAVGEYYCAAC